MSQPEKQMNNMIGNIGNYPQSGGCSWMNSMMGWTSFELLISAGDFRDYCLFLRRLGVYYWRLAGIKSQIAGNDDFNRPGDFCCFSLQRLRGFRRSRAHAFLEINHLNHHYAFGALAGNKSNSESARSIKRISKIIARHGGNYPRRQNKDCASWRIKDWGYCFL